MTRTVLAAAAALALIAPLAAQEEAAPSPGEIVASATASEWVAIAPEDLLVMTLAPAADGTERKVVIQLMAPPFSQGWVENIRTLARSGWYDGISVNRVQDNYVVQWGDANHDNPEASGAAKPLPQGLNVMDESDYINSVVRVRPTERSGKVPVTSCELGTENCLPGFTEAKLRLVDILLKDNYAGRALFKNGWPFALETQRGDHWPVHCYGMVGVGRSLSPDTGSGAELYTVIGHAPRHLDRNIALVGRVIEGIEHLSSLPRGKGDLGFYTDPAKRTPILSIRVASDLPQAAQPEFAYLSTDSETFARYAEARANRRDPFFIVPAGGADVCNIPVPVRRVQGE